MLVKPIAVAALLSLSGLAGNAQSNSIATGLSQIFTTDLGNQAGVAPNGSYGVGYDAANFDSLFASAATQSTAQSYVNAFRLDSGSGYTGADLSAGQQFQIGLNAYALSRGGNGTVAFDAAIYAATGTGSSLSIDTSHKIYDSTILVTASNPSDPAAGKIWYSNASALLNPLNTNTEYVIAVTPETAGNPTTNFATVQKVAYSQLTQHGFATSDQSIFTSVQKFNNDGSSFTGGTNITGLSAAPFVYHFAAGAAAPVPEMSTVVSFGLFGLLGVTGALRMRRRS